MDTRFYRVDNGRIRWFNIDLPQTMAVRGQYLEEPDRVTNIAASAMDESWTKNIPDTNAPVLVIIEDLTMYLNEDDIRTILSIISRKFNSATVVAEILNPMFVRKNIEKSIGKSGAVFTWGAKSGETLVRLCPQYQWLGDHSLVEGMKVIAPVYKVIGKIGFVRNLSNKICVLERRRTNP